MILEQPKRFNINRLYFVCHMNGVAEMESSE